MSAADQLAAQAEAVIDETIVLARIPAPPLDEAQRAEFVRQRLANAGLRVSTDATGNVLAETDGIAPGPALTVAAHLDTVFSRDVRHESRRERDRLFGPGVGDNTVAVAALLALARQLAAEASPMPVPVHLLFSVGEEGAGNLAGVRAYVAERGAALGAFLALEGHYLGRVSIDAVGSRRWLVRVDGRGGHSWEDFDTPSAVHALSRAIAALTAVEVPPDTAFNVGSIEGGQGINVIATSAAARIDLRSTSEIALTDLEAHMQHCFRREAAGTDLRVHFESLGARPAGRLDPESPLARACRAVLVERGITPEGRAASTDANAALAAGVPALSIGITRGGVMHTQSEWIELAPIADGLATLRATVDTVSALLAAG